jgi:peptidoglycan hydrolase-like amidase
VSSRRRGLGAVLGLLAAAAGVAVGWHADSALSAPQASQSPPSPAPLMVPDVVRVGLATDLERLSLPCCGSDLRAQAGETQVALVEPFVVEPAAQGERGVYRLQVAALKDEGQAHSLADQLGRLRGQPTSVVFDAATDLYRVRLGRFTERLAADEEVRTLAAAGTAGAFVVSEAAASLAAGLRVTQGKDSWRVRGRWVAIWSRSDSGVRLPQGLFRGRMLVYLNDRGTLNLINELSLENYLRGVVPREMGPELYDNLEALKAQAVAARSYAVRNLGEFAAEGYDICATPRCQVYGGRAAEHPLSDQAVAETAGQVVVYDGRPADALYSSTCGGHTEDVHVVFPLKNEPYLRAVPCYEAGLTELAGDLAQGVRFPDGLTRRLLPGSGGGVAELLERLRRLASKAGLAQPDSDLRGLERRELTRYLAAWLDVALDARLFVADPDVPYMLGEVPEGWSIEELRQAVYLAQLGVLDGPVSTAPEGQEIERSLLALAVLLRVVEPVEGRFDSIADGRLTVRDGDTVRVLDLPGHLATFRGREGSLVAAPLALVPGDHVELYLEAGTLVAAVQRVTVTGAAYDRGSHYSAWRRFRSDRELTALIGASQPGFEFAGLEVLERGRSGRVGRIRFTGRDGRQVEIEGLAVRWVLDLPDTLFTARRLQPPGETPGWLFSGRGWGHGVGLCQNGAYGMALRGHNYVDILTHYYTGVSLASLETVPRERYDRSLGGR